MNKLITYEQPLNEVIRACLRLEQLFLQIDRQLNDNTQLGTRNIIAFIIDILQLLDRPDLKTKLAKENTDTQTIVTPHLLRTSALEK